jgi:adenylate cyclase
MSFLSNLFKKSDTSWLTGVILVLSVAFAAFIISLFEFFQGFELRLYDQNFQRRGPLQIDSTDIAIVAMDQPTFDELPFPLDRALYGEVIQKLNGLGAKLIVFDILFTGPSDKPASDSMLRAAVLEAGNVVLSGEISQFFQPGISGPIRSLIPPHYSISDSSTQWGLVNDFFDHDGVSRRYPLFLPLKGINHPSLGSRVFSLLTGVPIDSNTFTGAGDIEFAGRKIPRIQDYSSTLINYAGPAKTFPTYSLVDVLNGSYDFAALLDAMSPEDRAVLAASGAADVLSENPFKGKVVLIGASAEDLQDNKITPYFSSKNRQRTPGVEVHANAIQMLQSGNFIRQVKLWIILIGVFLLSFLTYTLGKKLVHWSGILVTTAMIVLILVSGVLLFVKYDLWLRQMPLLLAVALGYPSNLLYRFIVAQREKAMIRGMFAQYVPKSYVHQLINNPDMLKLGGERRRMTMLFTDVAGFTTVSEKLTPEELVALLNEYLTAMTRVVFAYDGIVDKYEGDLVMAEWGAPIWIPNHAAQACRTGLGMQKRLAELRVKWKAEGRNELYSRVGINTGDVIVGNMGSEEKFDYTVMGDAVNLASRLEGANKSYDTTIMIGKNTYDDVKDEFVTRPLDLLRV